MPLPHQVPSFDEPEFKAVFRLSVIHPNGSSAVSNAKELREQQPTYDQENGGGGKNHIFRTF